MCLKLIIRVVIPQHLLYSPLALALSVTPSDLVLETH